MEELRHIGAKYGIFEEITAHASRECNAVFLGKLCHTRLHALDNLLASAFERKYKREELKAEIAVLKNSNAVATENRKLLDKIDFRKKRFKKSTAKLKYFTQETETKANAEKYIAKVRNKILEKFEKEKNLLHQDTDPACLDDHSYVFDARHWTGNLSRPEQDERADEKKRDCQEKN